MAARPTDRKGNDAPNTTARHRRRRRPPARRHGLQQPRRCPERARRRGRVRRRRTTLHHRHGHPRGARCGVLGPGAGRRRASLGIDLRYANNVAAPEQATLVQNAIDSQVDGIAVTLAFPDAVGPAVQAAAQAGIPVVAFNSGIEQYEQYGAMMYFGSDEQLAGQSLGERMASEGAGKAICVVHEQGNISLETRCAGVTAGMPNTENLNVDGTNLPAVQATITAKLQQDPAITHIVTLDAGIAGAALAARDTAGSEATIATFDLNPEVIQAIQDGEIAFSVDQQPYLQGYLAVQALWLNLTNGNDIGGGRPVLTGPSFVDSSNIAQIAEYAANNTR
ncbi:substrate-binding domain-containing protein [Pseudonocardia nigra]|uniref:substrate-binding domain-containing protein n=1 Tax=Pseudonocardia nigra TaxID=1921578 RepID=UPI0027E2AC41|nr:substrate-binding domain-containing protein [Pseudonocardia nigra]